MNALAKLQADAQASREAFEAAQTAVEQASQAAEERRQVALDKHDRARLDGYDDAALGACVRAAQQRLREAVLNDPVMTAVIDLYEAQMRHNVRYHEALGDAGRFDPARAMSGAGAAGAPSFAELLAIATGEASRRLADEQDARDAERTAVGEKAAHRTTSTTVQNDRRTTG